MEFDWVDESRPDPLAPGRKRELDVFVWYPAEHAGAGPRAVYLRGNWLRSLRRPFPSPELTPVETHSWQDAPVARVPGTECPLVVLSSGFGGTPEEYTFLAEELASHGYMVAAPANTYAGPLIVFPDGRIANAQEQLPDVDVLVGIWADDISTVIRKMAELNGDSSSSLCRRVDWRRTGVIGHSFGGAATAQFCATEKACGAGIDLDGALHGAPLHIGTPKPFLFLLSGSTVPFQARLRGRTRAWEDSYRQFVAEDEAFCRRSANCQLEIERGFGHMNFSDSAVLFRPPLSWAHPMLGSTGGKRGLAIVRTRVVDFLDRNCRS